MSRTPKESSKTFEVPACLTKLMESCLQTYRSLSHGRRPGAIGQGRLAVKRWDSSERPTRRSASSFLTSLQTFIEKVLLAERQRSDVVHFGNDASMITVGTTGSLGNVQVQLTANDMDLVEFRSPARSSYCHSSRRERGLAAKWQPVGSAAFRNQWLACGVQNGVADLKTPTTAVKPLTEPSAMSQAWQ